METNTSFIASVQSRFDSLVSTAAHYEKEARAAEAELSYFAGQRAIALRRQAINCRNEAAGHARTYNL